MIPTFNLAKASELGLILPKKGADQYPPDELAAGIKVEAEHTPDPEVAAIIAANHLDEIADYYTRLARMEKGATSMASMRVGRKGETFSDFAAGHPNEATNVRVGETYYLNTLALEDWKPGQPDEIFRRVVVTKVYEMDGSPRVEVQIQEGPEKGRKVGGLSPGNLRK